MHKPCHKLLGMQKYIFCLFVGVRLEPPENLPIPNQVGAQSQAWAWVYHHSPGNLQPEVLKPETRNQALDDQMVHWSHRWSRTWHRGMCQQKNI